MPHRSCSVGAIFTVHFPHPGGGARDDHRDQYRVDHHRFAASPLPSSRSSSSASEIGWSGAAGIAVATTGILILVSRGTSHRFAMAAEHRRLAGRSISAHTWAIYTVVTRDLLDRRRHPLAVALRRPSSSPRRSWPSSSRYSGILSRIRSLSPRGIVALLLLAIPGLALGQWFWQVLQNLARRVPASISTWNRLRR